MPFLVGAQQDFARVGNDRAARKIERRLPNRAGNLGESQPVASERGLADFNRDFIVARTFERHQRDARLCQQIALELLGRPAQRLLADVADDRQRHDTARRPRRDDDGSLGVFRRKIAQPIDRRLDIVFDQLGIRKVTGLDGDDTHIF